MTDNKTIQGCCTNVVDHSTNTPRGEGESPTPLSSLNNPTILHLTLKRKWFDLIKSGQKKFEFREIKNHWEYRLSTGCYWRHYDFIRFRNGYKKNAPEFDIELKRISRETHICHGKVFAIELGEILDR